MNRNNRNDSQASGYGQPYNAGGYPGSGAWPAAGSQQGYPQAQGGYPQAPQGYPQAGQGYGLNQQQPGYQAPQGYQINTGRSAADQGYQQPGYQTPQVTANQQPVTGGYQNPYAAQAPSQGQTGYYSPNAYPQGSAYPNAGQAAGYPNTAQAAGYPNAAQGAGPQGYPQAGTAAPGGSYIPQTPYSQGYASPGYGSPAGYAQGYNAYTQMGRGQQPAAAQQQTMGTQVPLNGGGYVPPPVPVRRRPFEMKDSYLIILSGVMLVLFAAGMFLYGGIPILKWIFLALAAGSIALLWVKPLVDGNKRLCYTIVFALLALVTVISMVMAPGSSGGGPATIQNGDPARATASAPQDDPYGQAGSAVQATASMTNTPEPEPDNSVTDRLMTFFYYWSANRYDDMLTICSPTWQSKMENPKTSLFALMANRTPKDYMVENVSGTDQDSSRTVTVTSLMDRNNGKDPVKYRLSVIMMKENDGMWYVDPQSLQTYEAAETPDPSVTETPGPTETPAIYSNTTLYYNPSGGEYYHLDQNCKRINERYLPLKGHFTYAELGNDPYNKLKPCAICGAPSAP